MEGASCLGPRGGLPAGDTGVCLGSRERLHQDDALELGLEEKVHLQTPGGQQFLLHGPPAALRGPAAPAASAEPAHAGPRAHAREAGRPRATFRFRKVALTSTSTGKEGTCALLQSQAAVLRAVTAPDRERLLFICARWPGVRPLPRALGE